MIKVKRSGLRKQEDRQKLLLCLLPMIKIFLFAYCPMIGFVIAFERFIPRKLFGSPWVGFKNFQVIFQNSQLFGLFSNAIILNTLYFFFSMAVGVILALFLFEMKGKFFTKFAQLALLLPLFVSWPLISLFTTSVFDVNGILTTFIRNSFGVEANFYSHPEYWRGIMTFIYVWRNAGITMMGYYAVLLNTDKTIYEAARIDGAGRFRCMWVISMASLAPMIILSFIMMCGNVIRSDFSMNFFIIGGRSVLYEKVDVLESYMYRALMNASNFGNMTAMDLLQAITGLTMSIIVNLIIKKISPEQAIF